MPEDVIVRDDLQIIEVTSYGDITLEDLRQSLHTIAQIHQDRELSRVFVDATQETSLPSTLPLFKFGSELAERLRTTRIAVAVSPRNREDMHFLETVTQNRGMQVRTFDSEEAALEWLLEE